MKKIAVILALGTALFAGSAVAGNVEKVAATCNKVYEHNLGGSAWRAKQLGMSYERVLELTGAAEDAVQLKILKTVWNSEIIDSQASANTIAWGVCVDHFEHYLSY